MRTTGLLFAVAIGALAISQTSAQETVRRAAPLAAPPLRPAISSITPVQVTGKLLQTRRLADGMVAPSVDARRELPLTPFERAELSAYVAAVGTAKATARSSRPTVTIEQMLAPKPAPRSTAQAVEPGVDASVLKKFTFRPVEERYRRYSDVPIARR